jgi:hypothetical protein
VVGGDLRELEAGGGDEVKLEGFGEGEVAELVGLGAEAWVTGGCDLGVVTEVDLLDDVAVGIGDDHRAIGEDADQLVADDGEPGLLGDLADEGVFRVLVGIDDAAEGGPEAVVGATIEEDAVCVLRVADNGGDGEGKWTVRGRVGGLGVIEVGGRHVRDYPVALIRARVATSRRRGELER